MMKARTNIHHVRVTMFLEHFGFWIQWGRFSWGTLLFYIYLGAGVQSPVLLHCTAGQTCSQSRKSDNSNFPRVSYSSRQLTIDNFHFTICALSTLEPPAGKVDQHIPLALLLLRHLFVWVQILRWQCCLSHLSSLAESKLCFVFV